MPSPTAPRVRAIYDAARVPGMPPPYDTVQLRVAYPAADPEPAKDPVLGIIGPDPRRLPLPVVVIHPNFNCGPELYAWLARELALAGFAAVTYAWVGPLLGGRPGLSTGIDLEAVAPGVIGSRSPHLLLNPMLQALASGAELKGALDLDRVVIGGHSAGGSLALLAANRTWHAEVCGAFSYAGHTRAQVPQGHGEDAYLPLPGDVPILLMGGTDDGVVDAVARQQTGRTSPGYPMRETLLRSVRPGVTAWLTLLDGANHYAFADGYDGSSGRGYLEAAGRMDPVRARELLGPLIVDFCSYCARADESARSRLDCLAPATAGGLAVVQRQS